MHLWRKQKNRKSSDEKDDDNQKKARLLIDKHNQGPFQHVRAWLFLITYRK